MKPAEFAAAIHADRRPVILVIDDLNLGSMSVTNDIESVIRRCGQQLDLRAMSVIYKDSTGVYDEVLVINGAFAGFRSLGNTTDLRTALECVSSSTESSL